MGVRVERKLSLGVTSPAGVKGNDLYATYTKGAALDAFYVNFNRPRMSIMSRRVSLNLHTPPRKGASIDDLCKIFEFMTPLSPSDADIISGHSLMPRQRRKGQGRVETD